MWSHWEKMNIDVIQIFLQWIFLLLITEETIPCQNWAHIFVAALQMLENLLGGWLNNTIFFTQCNFDLQSLVIF